MTSRALSWLRLAIIASALVSANGIPPDAPKNADKVDSPVAPFKPADPDDLVVGDDTDDDDDDAADKDEGGEN